MSATYHAQFVISGTDRLSGVFNRMAAATGIASRGMFSLGRAMDGVSMKSSMTEYALRRLRVGGILAMTAAFYGFSKGGIEFETAMADIRSITGLTTDEMQTLGGEIDRLSVTYGSAKAAITKVYQDVASKKSEYLRDTKALTQMTEAVLLLTRASVGMDEQGAVDTLTNSLNQFNLAADQSERMVHSLAAGAILGAALIPQIGESLVEVGSVANDVGMSFEDTNAALQILSKRAILGSRAGRMLRNVLVNMSMYGLNIEKLGFVGALRILNGLNLSVEEMGSLFGKENIVAGNALTEQVDLLEEWTKRVTGTNDALFQMNIRMETVALKSKRVGAYISNFLIKTWSHFSDRVVEPSIDRLLRYLDAMDRTEKGAERLNDALGNIGAVLTFAVALGGLWALLKVLTKIWSLVETLYIGFLFVSRRALALISVFGTAVVAIKIYFDQIEGFFYRIGPSVISLGKDILNFITQPFQDILNILNKIFGTKWSIQFDKQQAPISAVLPAGAEEFWSKYPAATPLDFKNWMSIQPPSLDAGSVLNESQRGSTNMTAASVNNATNAMSINTKQKLEVDLKVDGPASVKDVRSDGDILFTGDMGMLPAGAY